MADERKRILIELASDPLYEQMNRGERTWAAELETGRRLGAILEWKYASVKLRLGGGAYYTPDFFVLLATKQSASIEFHEFKGHWREASRARIKVAAASYRWATFKAVRAIPKKDGGGFQIETIESRPLGS